MWRRRRFPLLNAFDIICWKDPDDVLPEIKTLIRSDGARQNLFSVFWKVEIKKVFCTHFCSSKGKTILPAHQPASIMNIGRIMSPENVLFLHIDI